MSGEELFQKYLKQSPEQLPQFLQALSWEDVSAMSEEMARQAQAAKISGDPETVINLVSRSIPFLQYFEDK